MIMATAALLLANPQPDDTAINRAMTNVCCCGTHVRIRRAIKTAARLLKEGDLK
jgi:isoquinoline 1-oxidoreductase alpha subunit